jgi:NhaP-type Na+/H+ or K+/H+ antiporter
MSGATGFYLVLFLCMATVLGLAFVSKALSNRFIASEPMIAVTAGVVFGPFVLGWVNLRHITGDETNLFEQLSRLTLAVAIITATLRVGWTWVKEHLRDVVVILGLGLPLMWGLSFAAVWVTLPVSALSAVLLAAIVTPTDPVLAQAIVTSDSADANVPSDVRHLISADSAGNDGLAFLFVTIGLWLLTEPQKLNLADFAYLVLWELVGALAAGALIGWVVGRLMVAAAENWGEEASLLSATTALAFATVTGLKLIGMDGLFGVFGAGLALSAAIGDEHQARAAGFNHSLAELFQLPLLVLIGMILPFDAWYRIGWPLLFAVVLVLLIRRIPMLLLMKPVLRSIRDWPSAVFVGWFGPIGVGTVFYAAFVLRQAGAAEIYAFATAAIAGSVLAHGLTDTIGPALLARTRREKPPRAREPAGDERKGQAAPASDADTGL